jgi:hypothetical protein
MSANSRAAGPRPKAEPKPGSRPAPGRELLRLRGGGLLEVLKEELGCEHLSYDVESGELWADMPTTALIAQMQHRVHAGSSRDSLPDQRRDLFCSFERTLALVNDLKRLGYASIRVTTLSSRMVSWSGAQDWEAFLKRLRGLFEKVPELKTVKIVSGQFATTLSASDSDIVSAVRRLDADRAARVTRDVRGLELTAKWAPGEDADAFIRSVERLLEA